MKNIIKYYLLYNFYIYKLLLLFIFLIKCNFTIAQNELKFEHITFKDGMPEVFVNSLFVDHNKMLWLCTNNGLYNYNGNKFSKIEINTVENKFCSPFYMDILEDIHYNLYASNGLGYIKKERNSSDFTYIDSVKKNGNNNVPLGFTNLMTVDNNQKLWILSGMQMDAILTINQKSNQANLMCSGLGGLKAKIVSTSGYPLGAWFTYTNGAMYVPIYPNYKVGKTEEYFSKIDSKNKLILRVNSDIIAIDTSRTYFATNKGLVYFNRTTNEYKIIDFHLKIKDVLTIARDSKGLIYCCVKNGGIFVFDPIKQIIIKKITHIDNDPNSIASNNNYKIYIDQSDNLFVVSKENEISCTKLSQQLYTFYPCNSSNSKIKNPQNSSIQNINKTKNNIIYSTNTTGLNIADNNFNTFQQFGIVKTGNINCIYQDSNDTTWIAADKGIFIYNNHHLTSFQIENKPTIHFNYIHQLSDKSILACSESGIYKLNFSKNILEFKKMKLFPSETYDLYLRFHELKSGKIILNSNASNLDIAEIKNDTINVTNTTVISGLYLTFSKEIATNILLFATNDGFYIYNILTNHLVQQTVLKHRDIQSVLEVNDNLIAITNNSITELKWKNDSLEMIKNHSTDYTPNISSSYIIQNKKYFFGTENAFLTIAENLNNTQPVKYLFSSFGIKSNNTDIWSKLNDFDSCYITLNDSKSFTISVPKYMFVINNIYYNLSKNNNNWQEIKNGGVVTFNNLTNGSQDIYFNTQPSFYKAISKNIYFEKKIWQILWIQIASILLFSILILWFIQNRNKRLLKIQQEKFVLEQLKADKYKNMLELEQKKNEVEKIHERLADAELAALRSQMNPHFIFNTLNSINSFVIDNNPRIASNYLTKFAKLMRLILDNSRNKFISLEKELEALKLYILMESLRFDNKFEFELQINEDIELNTILVPPLILQPYIENAIWHGLLHKQEKGKVIVDIKKLQEKQLEVIITDNGIGRKKSNELKSKSAEIKKSFGMQITRNRLDILSTISNQINVIQIIDLYDTFGNASGTKVILNIPF